MCMYYPRGWEHAWRLHVLMELLSALFCPAMAAVCLCKTFWDSKLTAWIRLGCGILHWQIYTIVRPQDGNACVLEHSTLPRRFVTSRSHRNDAPGIEFTWRRIQSSRPSETFACPAWDGDESGCTQFICHSPSTPSHIPVSVLSSLPRCFCLQLFYYKHLSWISVYPYSLLLYY